jgi:hypothetical protein
VTLATVTVRGRCTGGYPIPSILLEIYDKGVKIKSKTISAVSIGTFYEDPVVVTSVGIHRVYGRMVLTNALGSYEFLTPAKEFELILQAVISVSPSTISPRIGSFNIIYSGFTPYVEPYSLAPGFSPIYYLFATFTSPSGGAYPESAFRVDGSGTGTNSFANVFYEVGAWKVSVRGTPESTAETTFIVEPY